MNSEYLRVFRAFSDESRIRVLELLCEGEQCACILLDDMKISQSTLSHHMKILCVSGIVKSRREGKWNYYSIDENGCKYAKRLLDAVANRDPSKLFTLLRVFTKTVALLKKKRQSLGASPEMPEELCCCSK